MSPPSAQRIQHANVHYHDAAAAGYDAKWGIDYSAEAERQVVGKLERALGERPARFGRVLEIGAGTGYFGLNLARAGLVEHAVATDVSEGMLRELRASAERLGLAVETTCASADALPYPDADFDLVIGHAVLHHLPDPGAALRELRRVLRPGGTLAVAGEPSRLGHRMAAVPKQAARMLAPAWRAAMRAAPRAVRHEHAAELEGEVDVWTFRPGDLTGAARRAGFERVRVRGEELSANWFGWFARVLELSAAESEIPLAWRRFALRGYLILQALDRRWLEPRLPPALFYNLLLSARAPA